MSMPTEAEPFFVFAYGSLIWRPDFAYTHRHRALVHGYERRFWQASHDHRGTPCSPGRVVTLVPVEGGRCEGLIYALPEAGREQILRMLDQREQDGYDRHWLDATTGSDGRQVRVLTWLAAPGNPSWAGEESLDELARLIVTRHGPSGSNREYLLRLNAVFVEMGIKDHHVARLAQAVEQQA